jgi:hypothetical protein
MKPILTSIVVIAAAAALCTAQEKKAPKKAPLSPPAETSATIKGKTITIKYSAPSMRGRDIFGPNGIVRKEPNYPVWRAGANAATALHTDADLQIEKLTVPKGDYTLFVDLDEGKWQLIVNKQTGQWGLKYDKAEDLGRVPMTMSKPPAPVESFKISLAAEKGNRGKLTMEWADVVASVPFTVK